jgi:flagella basal body P-ring formation protein FlgA
MLLTRSAPAGQILFPAMLTKPNEVERGDIVDVEVHCSGVFIRFSARAETGGHQNETVLVSATDSGRRLSARVQEKGKVVINADASTTKMVRGGDSGARPASSSNRQIER